MIPSFLKEKILKDYNEEYLKLIEQGYKEERPVTLRINNLKTTKKEILNYLNNHNITYKEVDWYENALIITNVKENIIKELDIYEKGYIYLQNLSSMLPPLFMNLKENTQILDMAAAPGGKTTEMSAISNNTIMITATEKNKIRFDRLKYNIEKQGAKKVQVLNDDARSLNEYFKFDEILLDAPCSGSGTLNLETIKNFNEDLINRSIKFQNELLEQAIKHLKPGCEMIYSTCSILKEENEKIISNMLNKYNIEMVPLDISKYKDLPLLPVNITGTICLYPNNLYEGFFVSKIKKNSD